MTRDQGIVDGWLNRAIAELSKSPDFVAEGLALDVAEQVTSIMDEQEMSRSELAEALGVNRSYITKVLNAPPNLTLRTIAAVAIALNAKPKISFARSVAPVGRRRRR